jgi:CHAT domain-containing protein/Tfp pilus assembly protein PilF
MVPLAFGWGACFPPLQLAALAQANPVQESEEQRSHESDVEGRRSQANQLNEQGVQQVNTSQYQAALQSFQQALDIYRAIGIRAGEGNSLNGIGGIYDSLGQYSKALDYYQQALVIFKEISNRVGEGIVLNNIGFIYYRLGQYPQALEFYQQALVIAKEIDNRSGKGGILNNIGLIYERLGQYPQALEFYQQALVIFKEISDSFDEGTTLNNIGGIYSRLGQYPQALEFYQQALVIAKEVGDCSGEGTTLNNIGVIHEKLGQYPQALEFYQQTLIIVKEIGDRSGEGNSLNGMGGIYSKLGKYPQALKFYQQSLVIAKEIGDRFGEGTMLNNIRVIYSKLGKYPQALEYYQQSLVIAQEIGDRSGEGGIHNNIGFVYSKLGQYPQSLEFYQQSLVIAQEIGDRSGEGTTLNNIGLIYNRLEEHPKALEYYQQALVIFKEIGDRSGEGDILHNIGSLLGSQKQPELAIVFLKQSVNTYEAIRKDLRVLPTEQQQSFTDTVADTYRKLADLLLKSDRILEAQRVLDLLKVQELEEYLRNVRGNAQTASGIEYIQQEQDILNQYNQLQQTAIELGRELAQLQKKEYEQQPLTPQENERRNELVQLLESIKANFNTFAQTPQIRQLIEKLSFTAREQTISLGSLDRLRDNLTQLNAVILYPLILDDRLELIITTPNAPPLRRTVEGVGREKLNAAITAYRQALDNPGSDPIPPAQQLYDWLIAPLEADLAKANATTIIYAPDSALRYIPLAALYDSHQPDGKRWLAQRYRINNITAASLEELNTKPQPQPHILAGAFADTTLVYPIPIGTETQQFRGLPFAGQEVQNLTQLSPNTQSFFDRAFSLQEIKSRMNAYNILHLATHAAVVPGDASQSFILFGNGDRPDLRAIENWSLSNIDLVVLSACETGLGGYDNNGEQILGLGYQFQAQGARAVMASLWKVSDGGTQVLMNAFYTALKNGKSKTEALQLAQQAMITGNDNALEDSTRSLVGVRSRSELPGEVRDKLRHPHYWAPFIVIGNGL